MSQSLSQPRRQVRAQDIVAAVAASAIGFLALAQPGPVQAASAQRAEQAPPTYPPQVRVRKRAAEFYYVDARGMTLYALNQRVAFSRSAGAEIYCSGACAQTWSPLSAPSDAKPVGDWSVIAGATGPQWAFRKNPVFTYRGDKSAGDANGDGYEDLWAVIVHVPPAPSLVAPPVVSSAYAGGRYVLTDPDHHVLFVASGKSTCAAACADWTPLTAGMAALDIGDWAVERRAPRTVWTWRGKPVFVSPSEDPDAAPAGGQVLQP